ncbi:MAG TPA: sugar kinase [Verrucomicrobiota bacterium]|nr:sugar kinase [Verrucomicrobiales bacterium]HRI12842.1 sugar kinase [Verrucomicrobiota bacterium]
MRRLSETKIILVTRPTRITELKRRFNTRMQAKFYVSHLGQDFSDYEAEDERYTEAVKTTQHGLETLGRVQVIDRSFLPNFVFGPEDVVVVLGQDGLVANTMKYLAGNPVIGVNPDPARWDGQLLPFRLADIGKVVPEVLQHRRPTKAVTMAQATLNTGQTLLAVNDLFIGPRTHTSARYVIEVGDERETQSSSGVIVSTGLGSTGGLRSLLTGASAIVQGLGTARAREVQPALEMVEQSRPRARAPSPGTRPQLVVKSEFAWDATHLWFTVREPFPSRTTQVGIIVGRVTVDTPLTITSQMPEHGVIFSDGMETDFLEFRSGTKAIVTPAKSQGRLVV